MEHLQAARVLMGDSLGFHIVFALLGIGLAVCMSLLEFIALRRKDPALRENARLLSYVATVLVVTGVISGTVIALQMFLIWPGVLQFGGSVIGLGFTLEGYMFILEAVFLAYYVASWNRIKGYAHWLLSIPVIIGSTGSAFFITAVNAFMNNPVGFNYINGKVTNPQPAEALFSLTSFSQFFHSVSGYYLTAALVVTAAYAWVLLRKKTLKVGTPKTAKTIVQLFALLSALLVVVTALIGHISAQYVAQYEPTKLAAIELQKETQSNAPLLIGGTANPDGSATGGIEIPGGLSILIGGTTDTVVKGLEETPQELWPPLILHSLFTIKMAFVGIIGTILAYFVYRTIRHRKRDYPSTLLRLLIIAPFLSVAVIELGWMLTELGRQPYAVYGYVLTKDAVTTHSEVWALAWLFPVVFILLLILTIWAIRLTISRFTPQKKGAY